MKRALITGITGQDGAYLAELLLAKGYTVHGLKRRSSSFNTGRIDHLYQDPHEPNQKFILHHGDLTDSSSLIRIIQQVQPDEIYNLACPASPPHYQYNAIKTVKTSVMGAINCLGLAKRVKARVFQASTSEVYGDPSVHPQPESYWGNVNPIGRRSCYDEGKRCAETLFFDYHRENKVDIRVVRIFNTYGPRMRIRDGRAVPAFISPTSSRSAASWFEVSAVICVLRAASISSSGICVKNCRNMKTKNGDASHCGMISGQNVSIIPRLRNRTKTGIIVTCAGSIIVESITMKRIDRPRKRNRANPNPTRLHETICPTTHSVVITTVFERAGQKFILSGASERG